MNIFWESLSMSLWRDGSMMMLWKKWRAFFQKLEDPHFFLFI